MGGDSRKGSLVIICERAGSGYDTLHKGMYIDGKPDPLV